MRSAHWRTRAQPRRSTSFRNMITPPRRTPAARTRTRCPSSTMSIWHLSSRFNTSDRVRAGSE